MLQNGIIERSQSQWSSPCVLVLKVDSMYRFCTDIRKVNGMTRTDSYPIPGVDDCIDKIGHTKYMSKLLKGYWQVPLSRNLLAFERPMGYFSIESCHLALKKGDLRTGWLGSEY